MYYKMPSYKLPQVKMSIDDLNELPGDKPKEKTMTRNEAIAIIDKIRNGYDGATLADTLIALGILKVEEEKKDIRSPASVIRDFLQISYNLTDDVIEALQREGYEIVKKGNSNAE